jgi:metal-sulfur cluster biosynthetic enzyme
MFRPLARFASATRQRQPSPRSQSGFLAIAGASFGRDSIIVTKARGGRQNLGPAFLGAIMEHIMSGEPVLRRGAAPAEQDRAPSPGECKVVTVEHIREALRQVIDPELGCNIVDLGLVYDVAIDGGGHVHVTMTTTTPGCPASSYLKQGAGEAVSGIPGCEFVEVKLSYEPRWTPEMMSPEAKAQFGIRDEGRW